MRLWVDAQCLQTDSRKRGIGRYVLGLLDAMAAAPRGHTIVLSLNATIWESLSEARDQALQVLGQDHVLLWQGAATSGEAVAGYTTERAQSALILSHHVRCVRADVCLTASAFEGHHDASVPYLNANGLRVPWAALYFDAIPSRFPQQYLIGDFARSFNERRVSALKKADALLAISEFSADEANRLIGTRQATSIGGGLSSVFVHAVEHRFSSPRGRRRDDAATILYVGGLDWRKNVFAVVDAIAKLPADLRDSIRFVCIGDAPASARDQLRSHWIARQLRPYALVMRPFVCDEELIDAYSRAAVTIQPSLMEGFGLTVLEAMACGCPVLVSRAGALPELVDSAEALFDPASSDDIAHAIERILRNEELRLSLAEHGTQRARLYTWQRCAELAWNRLEMLYESTSAPPTLTLAQIREQTNAQLTIVDQTSHVAELMAVAENLKVDRRLYVDVTSVSIDDRGTGIQRVVKNSTRELLSAPPAAFEVRLVRMEKAPEWRMSTTLERPFAEAVRFASDDIVLMMDSVWDFMEQQEPLLRQARAVGAKVVFVLYDLIPVYYPAFCDDGVIAAFSNWFKRALAYADGWLCISKAVADDLLLLLSAIGSTTSVNVGYWRLGSDHFPSTQAPPTTSSRSCNRFLMVGTIEPRKGHSVALAAFQKLWNQGSADELWIAGQPGWHVESLVDRIKRHPQFNQKLRWIESPSDEQLASLYQQASAVILASYAEGFGLPIVEAMRFEKPLIVSDLPVFHEAAGDSAVYFEAGNADALAGAVRRFTSQPYVQPDGSRWIDWAESARQLQRVVLGANWYRRFQPDSSNLASKRVRTRLLDPNSASAQGTISLVEAPTFNVKDHMYRTVVQICNQSAVTWSTTGVPVGAAGITIGCRLIDANGDMVPIVLPDAKIPLAIGPGTCLVAALSTPETVLQYGSRIRIGVVQHDQWWPWFVDVDLPR